MGLFNVTVELEYREEIEIEREDDEFDNPEESAQSLAERMVADDIANGAITIESFEMKSEVEEVDF